MPRRWYARSATLRPASTSSMSQLPEQARRVRAARKVTRTWSRSPPTVWRRWTAMTARCICCRMCWHPCIAQELVAGEPSREWKLRRDLPTSMNIGGDSEVGLEVLPKTNDRWWSILKR